MTREKKQFQRQIVIAVDLLATALTFLLAYVIRDGIRTHYTLDLLPHVKVLADAGLDPITGYAGMLAYIVPVWGLSLAWTGTYRELRLHSGATELRRLVAAAGYATVGTFGVLYLFKLPYIGRSYLLVFSVLNIACLFITRRVLAAALPVLLGAEVGRHHILVVGTSARARTFAEQLRTNPDWRVTLVGFIDRDPAAVGSGIGDIPIVGTIDGLSEVLHRYVVDEVVFAVPRSWLGSLDDAIYCCEVEGIRVAVLLDLFNVRVGRPVASEVAGCPALAIDTVALKEGQRLAKRALDLLGALTVLVLAAPVMSFVALLVRLTSPGSILFRQERVGLNGRRFTLYKFRTMVADADQRRHELMSLNEMDGPVFKITRDPRVTPLGQHLRRLSLDELPQLFNVLKGDMSLVGPRPPLASEVVQYEPWQRRRLSVKPGITCFWQIKGRNKIGFRRWMALDLEYIDNWSLWLDLKILFWTIPVVLKREGAS